MYFILSKLLWFVFCPSNFLVLMMALGTALSVLGHARKGRVFLIPSLVAFLAIGFSPIDEWSARTLETRFRAWHDDGRPVDGVIILGGSINIGSSAAWDSLSLNSAADRIVAMSDLARRYPSAKLVFTGGYGALLVRPISEADILDRHIATLGVSADRVIYERQSRNTRENAVFTKEMLNPKPSEHWLLVTSAWHMPRSIGLFRKAGWNVDAYPVGWTTAPGHEDSGSSIEISNHLAKFDMMFREWIGLITARLAGYSDDLLPGP